MCCCKQPNVNGTPGYQWQPNDAPSRRAVNPPDAPEGAVVLYDEPGRCGGLDCHAHHFRVIREHGGNAALLVRNGSGDHRMRLSNGKAVVAALAALDTHGRYWLLHAVYSACLDSRREAEERVTREWSRAAAEKRIRTRRHQGTVRVWVETPIP
jgi:hypothetical protein